MDGGAGTSKSSADVAMEREIAEKRKRELLEDSGMTREEAETCTKRARQQEVRVGTRSNVLNVVQGDFSFAVTMANEVVKSKNDKPTSRSGAVGARAGTDKSFGMQCDPKFPIIIVPEPTMRARLCMWNVVQFLHDGKYVKVEVAKQKAKGAGNSQRARVPRELFMTAVA